MRSLFFGRMGNRSQCQSRGKLRQQGMFLVLFAVVSIVLIAMLGLLIGSGFLASNRTLLQNTSNNVALAAIEGYSSTRSQNFYLRSCAGRTRAERVMERNDIKGFNLTDARLPDVQYQTKADIVAATPREGTQHPRCSDDPNPSASDSAANLLYGNWYEDQRGDPLYDPAVPNSGTPACLVGGTHRYPCFVAANNVSAGTQVSAVRVDLTTTNEPPFFLPFAGQSGDLNVRSFGVVVPRCFAGVVDLSYSSVTETHPLPAGPGALFGAPTRGPLGDGRMCTSCGDTLDRAVWLACQNIVNDENPNDSYPGALFPACEVDPSPETLACDSPANPCVCRASEAGRPFQPEAFGVYDITDFNDPHLEFLNGGWERPWIPRRGQKIYPLYNETLEPPFLGLPFLPLDFLRVPLIVGPNGGAQFYTLDRCNRDISGTQFFSPFIWCNMWRGRDQHDLIEPYAGRDIPTCGDSPQMSRMWADRSNGPESDKLAHFWSDFDPSNTTGYRSVAAVRSDWLPKPHQSPYGPLFVDRMISPPAGDGTVASTGPEPLSRYLNAMNAAFRLVAEQSAAGDRALVLGFAGDLMYQGDTPGARQVAVVPGEGMENDGGATPDFSLLAQLTNPLGRGAWYWDGRDYNNTDPNPPAPGVNRFAEYHPNFVDAGFVSRFVLDDPASPNPSRVGHTNILKALLSARARLMRNDGNGCGPGAIQSIVLFTDGINTCAPRADFVPGANWDSALLTGAPVAPPGPDWFACDPRNPAVPTGQRFNDYYQTYEDYLLGRTGLFPDGSPQGFAALLKQSRIAFNAVVDGKSLGARWRRVRRPNRQNGESDFLRISELRTAGAVERAQVFPSNSVLRSDQSALAEGEAFTRSADDAYFRRPLDTLGRLAFETGGIVWPILPKCQPAQCGGCSGGCYESSEPGAELKDCAWGGSAEYPEVSCSPLNYSESEQAAFVMIESVGQKPFSLREPVAGDIR